MTRKLFSEKKTRKKVRIFVKLITIAIHSEYKIYVL